MTALILFILSASILSLLINVWILISRVDKLKKAIESNMSLLADLQIKTSDLQCDLSYEIETTQRELMVQLLHIEAMLIPKEKTIREIVGPVKRRSRTEEQKELASKIMKERWAKKRQEQKASAPDVIEVIQMLPAEN